MRWWRRGAALLTGLIGTVGFAACAPPASNGPTVTLIGDSTMAGMVWYENATHPQQVIRASYNLTIDAESCRRLVAPSCRGRFGYVPSNTMDVLRAMRGRLGSAVVIMAGYDDIDIAGGIDAVMSETLAQGVKHVIWLNYPTNVPYVLPSGFPARSLYDKHNVALYFASLRYPTLHVADWNNYSRGRGWLASDGIHMTPGGAVELARYIKALLDAYVTPPPPPPPSTTEPPKTTTTTTVATTTSTTTSTTTTSTSTTTTSTTAVPSTSSSSTPPSP